VLARINEGHRFIVRKWDAAPVEDFLARTHKWVPRRHFLLQPPDGIANHFFFFALMRRRFCPRADEVSARQMVWWRAVSKVFN
jgi:hypothetical protein